MKTSQLGRRVEGQSLVALFASAVVLFAAVGGCAQPDATDAAPPTKRPTDQGQLLERSGLVAAADRLAMQAEKVEGESGVALLTRAAELREASYALEGRQVDVLEALELWGDASERAESSDCTVGVGLARARAIASTDPARLYRDLYLLRHRTKEIACQNRIDQALGVLSIFEPSTAELAEIRQLAATSSGKSGNGTGGGAAQDPSQVIPAGGDQHVVVPELLEKALKGPTTITKIEPFSAEQTARLVVHVTHPTKFHLGALEPGPGRGPRLFVDIENASYEGKDVFDEKGLIERVRLGKQKEGTRVVLDLKEVVHHRVFYLPDPFRLVLDLSVRSPEKLTTPREIQRIVLDPGHGGHDPGAVGPNGLREKDVTLDIAHRAAPLLAREVGVSTLLTRDVDAFVPLDLRAARANAFHADLFVSIHLNSSENASSRGVMTFVLDSSRDTAASQIAARENSSTAAAAAELATSLSRIESSDRRAASELFASLLQRSAGASLRQGFSEIEDHGVRRAGFYVLAGAVMPAVLFEGSFISNPIEADRLNSEVYRQRLADAIVNAVRAYRQGL